MPFVRMMPNGRRVLNEIARSPKIEALAQRFVAHDGRFLIEILKDSTVSLIAIIDVDGKATDVARETCANGPELPKAVDRLIKAADLKIPLTNRVRLLAPANANMGLAR